MGNKFIDDKFDKLSITSLYIMSVFSTLAGFFLFLLTIDVLKKAMLT